MPLFEKKIPYSQILTYLTHVQKRQFQSLNYQSKRLLLLHVHTLYIGKQIIEEHVPLFLQWLRNNARYLQGIKTVEINVSHTRQDEDLLKTKMEQIFSILALLDYKNIRTVRCDIPFSLQNTTGMVQFFEKLSFVQILHISPFVFETISHLTLFKHIQTFQISPFGNVDAQSFCAFLKNNSWKYLSDITVSSLEEEGISTLFQQVIQNKSPLRRLRLLYCENVGIPDTVITFCKSMQIKKLKVVQISFYGEEFDNSLFLSYFLTPYVKELYVSNIQNDLLKKIGQKCESLEVLEMINAEYDERHFQQFCKENRCKELKSLAGYFNFLKGENLRLYFPKLEKVEIEPFYSLTVEETPLFLASVKQVSTLEFSTMETRSWKYIPLLQQFPHLQSISLFQPVLHLDDFHLLIQSLRLEVMKTLRVSIAGVHIPFIAPLFLRTKQLETIVIHFYDEQDLSMQDVQQQMVIFFDMLDSMNIKNKHLQEMNLIANVHANEEIIIDHHRERFSRLRNTFPHLRKAQIGWGWFEFEVRS